MEQSKIQEGYDYQPSMQYAAAFEQFLFDMIQYLDEGHKPEYYIPEERQILRLKNNLVSNIYIIYGTAGSGKTSCVLWATHQQKDVEVIIINCDIDVTEQQFIKTLHDAIKRPQKKNGNNSKLAKEKNLAFFENMKFDELNQTIINSGKKFVFAIKKCQRIAQMKKPTLFYNILEWINGPMKPYLGLVFLSRAFHFTDKLQKRVKSRLTAKSVTVVRPQGQKIIRILIKRFSMLRQKYEEAIKLQKRKHRKNNRNFFPQKLMWLNRVMRTIQNQKEFSNLLRDKIHAINTQFLPCIKTAILKSLKFHHLNDLEDDEFGSVFVSIIEDASLHIAPSYYQNLIKECPVYSILVLALIGYMGVNNRSPYTLSTVFQVYKEIVLNNVSFKHIKQYGSSKILFEKAIDKLLEMRIITMEDQYSDGSKKIQNKTQREIILSLPPEDLQQIISEMKNIPQVIKGIIRET